MVAVVEQLALEPVTEWATVTLERRGHTVVVFPVNVKKYERLGWTVKTR